MVVVAGGAYLLAHRELLARELRFTPRWLLPLAAAECLLLVVRGALLRRLCGALGVGLSWREATGLQAASLLANYVAPGVGGNLLRAGYLKGRHELSLGAFAGVLAATYLLQYVVFLAAGLAASLVLPRLEPAVSGVLGIALAAVGAVCVVAFGQVLGRPRGTSRLARFLTAAFDGWRQMRTAGLARPLLLAALQLIGTAGALASAFAALGSPLGPGEIVFTASLSEASILLNITPAGLGVVESSVGLAVSLLGGAAAVGVAAAGLRRLVNVAAATVCAGAAIGFGARPR